MGVSSSMFCCRRTLDKLTFVRIYFLQQNAGESILLSLMGLYPKNLTVVGLNHYSKRGFEMFVPQRP